ncbi:unnamed protein product [Chironomus riparius]|uniref:Uncharacterized protein n=1 Tax=Chironomus riparius TaxID=315576 RepID=A0A9N9WPU7_9DIPT|nr:unnamed protein product [Chironomus riparius]
MQLILFRPDPIISLIKFTATNGSMLFDLYEIQFVIFHLLCLAAYI